MKRPIYNFITLSLLAITLFSACKTDDDVTVNDTSTVDGTDGDGTNGDSTDVDGTDGDGTDGDGSSTYTVPSTYDFENVDFSGQTTRQDMLSELKAYIQTAHVTDNSVTLDATILNNMYANGTGFFISDNANDLNAADKQLKNKTNDIFNEEASTFLADAATASMSMANAAQDTAGISTGSRTILVNAQGFEYAQTIEKGLMGTTFMDQALNNYLTDIELDDNIDVTEGKGTDMAHHWDEAYGYFTDSKNFPAEGVDRFWGNYSNNRDDILGTNESLGNAFRTGRAAILADDIDEVTKQAAFIKEEWTKLAAANAIHYFNTGRSNYADIPNRLHQLSECYGFLLGVKVGGGNVDDIISTFESTGLYDITEAQLLNFATDIATQYGLTDVQDVL